MEGHPCGLPEKFRHLPFTTTATSELAGMARRTTQRCYDAFPVRARSTIDDLGTARAKHGLTGKVRVH